MKAIIESIEASIADIQRQLDRPVLDGTPYLLVADFRGLPVVVTVENGVRAFRSLDLLADHCCGAICYSAESVAQVLRRFEVNPDANLSNLRPLHRREFLKQRLDAQKTLLARLPAQLVALEA
ncbi:MAG TPA: hypothetical protein VEH04_16950 [Verrucomicrobiae bacterium]|nr:hypothetical protein [Verrucomicrobiae bacterium]